MVLWELTLATAYVLGLPRTYRIALRLQRRLIGPNHPRIRDFAYRRTKAAFTLALNVHKEIQRRDISVGRNIGNRILRLLDRMRPQANIRGSPLLLPWNAVSEAQSRPLLEANKQDSIKRLVGGSPGRNEAVDPPYKACVGGPFGLSIKGRFSDGLSRLSPKPSLRSLPVMALGLCWQPVRRNMESGLMRDGSLSQLRLPDVGKHPAPHVASTAGFGLSKAVLREDIAAWMRGPRPTS